MKRNLVVLIVVSMLMVSCQKGETSTSNSMEESKSVSNSEESNSSIEELSSVDEHLSDDDHDYLLDEDYSTVKKLADITKGSNDRFMYDEDFFGIFDGIKYQQLYYDNVLDNSRKDGSVTEDTDAKYMFYNDEYLRFLNRNEGYVFNLKTDSTFVGDFKRSSYRSRIYNKDVTLSVSYENQNPYHAGYNDREKKLTEERRTWITYRDEWLIRHLVDTQFLKNNNISVTHPNIIDSHTIKSGYSVIAISLMIENPKQIHKNYYNIGVIRDVYDTEGEEFYFFVMKSSFDNYDAFMEMIDSFEFVEKKGRSKSFFNNLPANDNPLWNEETKNYYHLLLEQERTGWGIFCANVQDDNVGTRQQEYIEAYNYNFDILPSYQHISWGGRTQGFPLENALKHCGGNGFNGKPVLQYSFQITDNNNNVASAYTPMFDVYRGPSNSLDLWNMQDKLYIAMRQMAKDIKAYGHPVLFRLNNEMNTDWTSYCGMVTLCDPDIFIATWRRLYKIFEAEGVDNCIFIFNPIFKSCPFSAWGEDMSYFPGEDYVQALGLTYYEDNNGNTANELTFRKDYTLYYEKNKDAWIKYPWIISEFGCGAGGDSAGAALYRNAQSQADYVTGMFKDFNDRKNNPYLQNIKGAVWFSVNDYAGNKVTNLYRLDPFDKLPLTTQAFIDGLAKNK